MDTEVVVIGGGIFGTLMLVAICITLNSMNGNAAVLAMVDKGADPIAAKCSIDSAGQMCAVYVATHPK